jgi:hypothetical protein
VRAGIPLAFQMIDAQSAPIAAAAQLLSINPDFEGVVRRNTQFGVDNWIRSRNVKTVPKPDGLFVERDLVPHPAAQTIGHFRQGFRHVNNSGMIVGDNRWVYVGEGGGETQCPRKKATQSKREKFSTNGGKFWKVQIHVHVYFVSLILVRGVVGVNAISGTGQTCAGDGQEFILIVILILAWRTVF